MSLCVYRTHENGQSRLGLIQSDHVIDVGAAGGPDRMAQALEMSSAQLESVLRSISDLPGLPLSSVHLKAPVDWQEVWAAGVTYMRSRDARMEESTEEDAYDRVYNADRPELFMKANPHLVSGPGEAVAIRSDSSWDVPEPECALVINSAGETVGYTIGNDVSSRTIEGDNPLYLPQAKMYERCAALGPVIALAWDVVDPDSLPIRLIIRRGGQIAFEGETSTAQLHRTFDDLKSWLFRHNSFAHGVFLMTGTGIVPPSEFTLEDGDEVEITIIGIGTLTNPVARLAG